jgi:hypothetical protein
MSGVLKNNGNSLLSGLVACYAFDGNINDSLGLNNGVTQNNITYTTGKLGQAASFNGSNSYIQSSTYVNLPLGNSALTLCCWFKAATNGTLQMLSFVGAKTTNGGRFGMYIGSTGLLNVNFFNVNAVTTFNVGDNNWHFAAMTITGGTTSVTVYVDNQTPQIVTLSMVPNIITGLVTFGSDNFTLPGAASFVLNGLLDQCLIYNRPIRQAEVTALYNSGNGFAYPFTSTANVLRNNTLLSGLVANWPLDGNANDSLNNNNGTATNVSWVVGKIGQAASFNGTSSKIVIPSSASLNSPSTALTLCLWVNITSDLGTKVIALKYKNSGGSGDYYFLTIGGKFSARTDGGSGAIDGGSSFSTNTWYHLVLVWTSATKLEFFINSVSQGTDLSPGNISSTAYELILGNYISAGLELSGLIDDVQLYSRALTFSEISQLYNSGNGLAYPYSGLQKVLKY